MSGYKLNEQWIEDGRMYKAVPVIGSECGSCTHGTHKDYCQAPSMQGGEYECPVGESLAVKDLGPVNKEGCLAEERTGLFPMVENHFHNLWKVSVMQNCSGATISVAVWGTTRQEAIDAWNQRE